MRRSITFKSEGRAHYTPLTPPKIVSFSSPNPQYPSVPYGVRVSDINLTRPLSGSTYLQTTKPRTPKLTIAQVIKVKSRLNDGETATAIAADLGVYPSTITRIGRGEAWR